MRKTKQQDKTVVVGFSVMFKKPMSKEFCEVLSMAVGRYSNVSSSGPITCPLKLWEQSQKGKRGEQS